MFSPFPLATNNHRKKHKGAQHQTFAHPGVWNTDTLHCFQVLVILGTIRELMIPIILEDYMIIKNVWVFFLSQMK